MTSASYEIIMNMRVPEGYIETGRFFIGTDKETACEMFARLQGMPALTGTAMLRMDLVAQEEGIATVIQTLSCTLCEVSENMKTIMKETFKMLNLNS